LDTRVEGFLVEDGRVVGVHAGGTEVRAPSVVVTTGGFGNNLDLVKKWWPTVGVHGDRVWAVHRDAPFILGDGLLMGEAIGAEIVGYDHGLILPHSGFVKEHESELPPWVMLVNKQGRRFMDERAPYSVSGNLLNQQPDQVAWAIFDEEALTIGGNDKRYVDPYNIGWIRSSWGEEDIRDRTARGLIKSADSVEQLATMIGVDPEAVGITIERYNRDADQGVDTAFRKVADRTFPVRKPPFYAIEVRATLIGLTSTGLNIDGECRVLDRRGAPIGGLYAAGEVLGCVQGYTYGGGGMSIGAAVVYGRRAGIHAAEHARVPEHAA
jgi:fumarate reductase flavoprotein subunit